MSTFAANQYDKDGVLTGVFVTVDPKNPFVPKDGIFGEWREFPDGLQYERDIHLTPNDRGEEVFKLKGVER
jgi:hypothetical protein